MILLEKPVDVHNPLTLCYLYFYFYYITSQSLYSITHHFWLYAALALFLTCHQTGRKDTLSCSIPSKLIYCYFQMTMNCWCPCDVCPHLSLYSFPFPVNFKTFLIDKRRMLKNTA